MNKVIIGALLCLSGVGLGACAATPEGARPETSSTSVAEASSAPTIAPPASPPARPNKAADLAQLRRSLVTANDLGKPWVHPKAVSRTGKGSEICPGHRSATAKISRTAETGTDLTEGSGAGKNIGSFRIATLPATDTPALRAAYAKDQRSCASYRDTAGFYVLRTADGPGTMDGADEVVSAWSERIYYDKGHRKLAYARHTIVARTGRVISYVGYAFLTTAKDPKAKDFSRATRLQQVQLDKIGSTFTS